MNSSAVLVGLFCISLFACGSPRHAAAPARTVVLAAPQHGDLYAALSLNGPTRFSQVSPHLYRGGQPTHADLERMRELGIKTVISLRNEAPWESRAEQEHAKRLGMTWLHFPFSGMGEPDPTFIGRVVQAIHTSAGPVYVHCRLGRDRTSLVVSLYRVWCEGRDQRDTWQKEAVDFGFRPTYFLRGLEAAYYRFTSDAKLKPPFAALPPPAAKTLQKDHAL